MGPPDMVVPYRLPSGCHQGARRARAIQPREGVPDGFLEGGDVQLKDHSTPVAQGAATACRGGAVQVVALAISDQAGSLGLFGLRLCVTRRQREGVERVACGSERRRGGEVVISGSPVQYAIYNRRRCVNGTRRLERP
jgi:hypothetical protein